MTTAIPAFTAAQNAILDAAEMLFGRYGPEGVSLRQISAAAGSANNSAVQYHFHNKDGLIEAIFRRRLPSLDQRRAGMLETIGKEDGRERFRGLLAALLAPIAEETDASGSCSYAAFLLGLMLFGDPSLWYRYRDIAPVTASLHDLLQDAATRTITPHQFSRRLRFTVSLFLSSMVQWDREHPGKGAKHDKSRQSYIEELIDFAAAGFNG